MSVRKVPVVLSLLATLALLFGGWFIYQKTAIEEPIRTEVNQMTSAKLADLLVDKERIEMNLTITKPDQFAGEYAQLLAAIKPISAGKQVEIHLTNQDPELKQIWSNGIFDITEAMDLHQYSRIPAILNKWKDANHLDLAASSMDDTNVYIYLQRGSKQYYAILPRLSQQGNEVTIRG
ncbi:hypothetical protein [Brevibacillus massiliensis]|uniref:hypothetical protein n=1 Tax=Brevibacillus massiliensis TaxID=1118054 RepID=UPI0003113FB6|nr:hypothetical protein [Brevibacillus massiliensis]